MISTPVLIAALILVVVILIGNTMIAIAFLRGRRDHFRSLSKGEEEAMNELHRRVQELLDKKD